MDLGNIYRDDQMLVDLWLDVRVLNFGLCNKTGSYIPVINVMSVKKIYGPVREGKHWSVKRKRT
jgi:hypothetical protein